MSSLSPAPKPSDLFLDADVSISDASIGSVFDPWGDCPIGEAHARLAEMRGVYRVLATSHGTTMSNKIALVSLVADGDAVLVERDCHGSILKTLVEIGARPVWLLPRFDTSLGIYLCAEAAEIERALRTDPEIRAVVVTSPKYYGHVGDIAAVVQAVHRNGLPILADSAHGACLPFHPALPIGAAEAGADLVTESTHKTTGAFSQSSVLLINNVGLEGRILQTLNGVVAGSTSFSVPILLSGFQAADRLAAEGTTVISRTIDLAQNLRRALEEIQGICTWRPEVIGRSGIKQIDPTRVVVDVSALGISGWEVDDLLQDEFGIIPEMGSLRHVLFLVQFEHTMADVEKAVAAFREIARRRVPTARSLKMLDVPESLPRQVLLPRHAFYAGWHGRTERLAVRNVVGRVSAETLSVYPPGSPLIVSGEVLSQQIVDYLQVAVRCGATLKGATDPSFATMTVITDEGRT